MRYRLSMPMWSKKLPVSFNEIPVVFCLQAKKVIPQMTTNKCTDLKSELFDELLQQMRGSSYAIDCCCDCGKKGIRKLRFNYTTGDKAKFWQLFFRFSVKKLLSLMFCLYWFSILMIEFLPSFVCSTRLFSFFFVLYENDDDITFLFLL